MKDKRIDEYIEKSAPFAQPVLRHLRELIHDANPETTETIKWGMPAFEYKGPLCSMASFKNHCVFGFWKSKLLHDPDGNLGQRSNQGGEAMGNLGRITGLNDLPADDILKDFVKQASRLNDEGIKSPPPAKKEKGELIIPDFFRESLKKNKNALTTFEKFSISRKREYIEWISEAKTESTKNKRMETAIIWMSEGKSRNWQYDQK